jgi:adenylate cyclase
VTEDEEATIHTLTAYRQLMATLIAQHRGRVVDSPGDNLLAEFASAVDAVRGAVEIQRELRSKNADLPPERRMEFRIGINVGDVVVEGERLYGDGVNIAARLEALAEGGGICIAGTVYDQVENKLILNYEYLGEQTVKNIAKPVRVYRVRIDAEAPAIRQGRSEVTSPLLPLPDKPSLVVLPFINLGRDPEQEYFSDGITEDITTELSRISSLFVISRNSAFTYKGKAAKARDISHELGVQYVLEGSIRKASERIRITAQLIDATIDHHLWAERYDRPLTDIFAVQDEIVQRIVTTLRLQLSLWEQGVIVRKVTDNIDAYDYYLRGQQYCWRLMPETNTQARQMFERALELDPQYAQAYASLGYTYFAEWAWQWNPDPQNLEHAFAWAQKAVALDDTLPQVHTTLGSIYLFKKQFEPAKAEFERAIALDPNFADAYVRLGSLMVGAGQLEEAVRLMEKGIRLNPRQPSPLQLNYLGLAYSGLGRYEEGIAMLKRALSLDPNLLFAHVNLAAVYSGLGRDEEARTEVATVLRLNPQFSLEGVKQTYAVKDPTQLEPYLAALRRVGLK